MKSSQCEVVKPNNRLTQCGWDLQMRRVAVGPRLAGSRSDLHRDCGVPPRGCGAVPGASRSDLPSSYPSPCLIAPWHPSSQPIALIHIAYEEEKLRHLLKTRGATWEPALRRWRVPLPIVHERHLENRLDSPPPCS